MTDPHAPGQPPLAWTIAPDVRGLRLGLVWTRGLTLAPAPAELSAWCAAQLSGLPHRGMAGGEERREAVRALLRTGGFKPAGRSKPAQEYLLRTVGETGTVPSILNAVDVLNVISVQSGLPISLLAADRLGRQPRVRYGVAGERFVFNRSGQELDVEGLLCVCAAGEPASIPLGSPVKDSMAGKVTESDRDAWVAIYAPAKNVPAGELERWCCELAGAYRQWCSATETSVSVLASADCGQ